MAYRILYDNQLLFDPYTDDVVTDAKLTFKYNNPDYFDVTLAYGHSLWNTVQENAGIVDVYFDNIKLFSGIIESISTDFDNNKTLTCNGALTYLESTLVRPYSTVAGESILTADSSVDGYFQWLIDQHNKHTLDSRKRFTVDVNQGAMLDSNNYIYRASEQLPTTWSEINDKILDSLGGYIFVDYKDSTNVLNLYGDVHDKNDQVVDFGVNLLDFTKTVTTSDQYTAIRPSGYTPEAPESDKEKKMYPITIESLPDNVTDYNSDYIKMGDVIYSQAGVQRYGYREYQYSNTDIQTVDGLMTSACKVLTSLLSPALTITIKAVDLALYMPGYKHLKVGQAVRCRSIPHGVDEYLMVNSISLDVNDPGNTEYELGVGYDTLTGQQSSYLKSLNSGINKSLDSVAALDQATKNAAEEAKSAKEAANEAATKADDASAKADEAATKADSVNTKADDAVSKAESASSIAADANTKASEAASKADEANAKVTLVEKSATEAKTAADNAKKAADDATTAAGNAQTSADNANKAATDAKNAADSATTAASTAQSTADSALSSANKANEEVGNVKSQLTEINKEMTSVKQDAADLRDDLSGQITTVKETMEADYAKKSELSETESNLKTEITKSATGVMTEVSQTYSTKKELETTTKAAQDAQATADAAKKATESNASDLANAVTKFDKDVSNLQTQIDGAIQTWFYDGIPDATTEPEKNWTSDTERNTHLGDLYYDKKTGFCYRYMNQNGVYSWERIQDTEVTKAIADAAAALTTANSKKRIFVTTPTPPYDVGDLWTQGSGGDILKCQTPKISGQAYAAADWVKASKYTDDTAVTNLANTVEKTYATKSNVTQLSDRIEQTVSSVEEVRTDASAAKTAASNAQKAADAAQSTADSATTAASDAQKKADDAATAASNAQTAADTAKSNAASAASAAATAKSAADTAQKAADAAKTTAASAQKDADAANADLATAKKSLEAIQNQADATDAEVAAAKTAVDKAQKAADSANSAASAAASAAKTAQSTADTAKTNAANAQTKANQAATAASNAQSTADTAKTNAATAQTKANEAASAASTAQSTADTAKANAKKAQDDVDALKNRVTTAETKITQNSEAIALRATKTEVTSAVDNIKVGGRNLVVGSSNGGFSLATSFDKVTREYTKSTSGTAEVYMFTGILSDFQIGSQYTLSFWAKKDANVSSMEFFILPETFSPTGIVLNMNINATTEYKYFVYTFIVPNVQSIKNTTVRFDNNGSKTSGTNATIYVKDVKLERGNKATDWSPAPEDLEADATTKANKALADSKTYTDAQLKVTSDSITSTVSKTYATKSELSTTNSNVTAAQNTANSASSKADTAQSTANSVKNDLATNYRKFTIPDTRNANQPPSWYLTNYKRSVITEFKHADVIGLSGEAYCSLETIVPWNDSSGGYPKQRAMCTNKTYWRVGTDASTWSDWSDTVNVTTMQSSIIQMSDSIKSSVEATYVSNDDILEYAKKSEVTQVSDSLTARISTTQSVVDGISKTTKNVEDYMKFESGPKLTIGTSSSAFKTVITNTGEQFVNAGQTVMELDGVTSTVKANRIKTGKYQWQQSTDGNAIQLIYLG